MPCRLSRITTRTGISANHSLKQPRPLRQASLAFAEVGVGHAQAARHEAAHEAYEIGHCDAAFAAFALLADEGHCEAARIAQEMVRYGRPLYATAFTVAPGRLARWRTLPGCGLAPTTR